MKFGLTKLLALIMVGATVASCSIIYQPVKNEGTVFNEQQVEKIHQGLNKDQVLYYLGSPNIFNSVSADKWYYVQRDVNNRSKVSQKVYFVEFKDNKVVNFGWVDSASINQSK